MQNRGEPGAGSPFQLDGVFIDASSGKVISTPTWPSNSRYAGIVAANDQGFVIQRGDELELLSTESRAIRRISLPALPGDEYAHDRSWTPRSSWSGKHLVLLGWRTWNTGPWLWVDSETLKVLESWRDVGTGPVSASDDELVMQTNSGRLANSPPFLEAAAPGGQWKAVPSTTNAYRPQFVGPNLLYFERLPTLGIQQESGAFLMHTDTADILRLDSPRKGWGLGKAAVSRTSKRFAILVGQTKESHPALDISGHGVLRAILIFDPPFTTPSFTLYLQNSRLKNPDLVALSPDGRHLAVFGYPDPVLEVFELPPGK